MVNQLSAILRLAVALDRRQIGAISHIQCEYFLNFKEFKMFIFPSMINDECALEMWSLDYKKGIFEEEFGLKFVATLMNR
jgi:exopolyphosphatase/guanosine-5'-triphosphate,3'-diphosphate pyrophosphatase